MGYFRIVDITLHPKLVEYISYSHAEITLELPTEARKSRGPWFLFTEPVVGLRGFTDQASGEAAIARVDQDALEGKPVASAGATYRASTVEVFESNSFRGVLQEDCTHKITLTYTPGRVAAAAEEELRRMKARTDQTPATEFDLRELVYLLEVLNCSM